MVERAGTETSRDRSGEDGGGQAPTLPVSTEDHERDEREGDHECRLVQYPPQLRLIEQRSGRSPSVVIEALELCLLLIDGMALFFAPVDNVVLSAVLPSEAGQASGANNAIREAGGVFGVAVLASVFGLRRLRERKHLR
jgi:hypothetical protein